LSYSIAVVMGGGIVNFDSIRGLLGLAGFMLLIGLIGSAVRPFRRLNEGDFNWNRCVDAVLIPLFGAWAAGAIFTAIPHLSSYDVPWSDRVGLIELTALILLIVRFVFENIARVVVAQRLHTIENEDLPEPPIGQKVFSRFKRAGVFAFVAEVFVGLNLWLILGTLMFLIPRLIDFRVDQFPNNSKLYRWMPRGIARTVGMMFVMMLWGVLVESFTESGNVVGRAFVVMSIPGLLLGICDWFARDGQRWKSTILSKSLGVVTLLIGIVVARGLLF